MNKSLKALVLAIISTALLAVGAVSSPANAVSPLTVTVSKTSNLALAGETVTVSISGIPSNAFVYAYQCASTSLTPRPSSLNNCVDASHAIALTNDVHFIGYQGILDGSQPQNLPLVKSFVVGSAAFDCTKIECAIFIRRGEDGHGNGSDTTYDQLIPLTFETPAVTEPTTPKLKKASTTKFGFDSGTSGLSTLAKANLKKKVSDFKLATTVTLTVEAGAATGITSKAVTRLAKNRADVIKKYLIKLGVSADKIVIKTKVINPGMKPVTKVAATP